MDQPAQGLVLQQEEPPNLQESPAARPASVPNRALSERTAETAAGIAETPRYCRRR